MSLDVVQCSMNYRACNITMKRFQHWSDGLAKTILAPCGKICRTFSDLWEHWLCYFQLQLQLPSQILCYTTMDDMRKRPKATSVRETVYFWQLVSDKERISNTNQSVDRIGYGVLPNRVGFPLTRDMPVKYESDIYTKKRSLMTLQNTESNRMHRFSNFRHVTNDTGVEWERYWHCCCVEWINLVGDHDKPR